MCNCSEYNNTESTTITSLVTQPPYDIVNNADGSEVTSPIDTTRPTAQTSCGIQIYSGSTPHIVTWCRSYNDTQRLMKTKMDLNFDPTTEYHNYKFMVTPQKYDEISINWCITVFVDDGELTEICGIEPPSISTKLVLHVWNRNNYVPEITDLFNVFSTKAYFKNLVMPPKVGSLCRYGNPFRGGTNPVIKYEAAIGTDQLTTDISDFSEVYRPCIPCYNQCSKYSCDSNCDPEEHLKVTFNLTNLYLQPYIVDQNDTGHEYNKTAAYYLTVRAVLGSGLTAGASSDGFYVDLTPPQFDSDIMNQIYIDVTQGEFTPVKYQASNDTIKAFWYCYDEQSMIKENMWAIGTSIGGEDIQPYISVGIKQLGINSSLEGVLKTNHTYYASIRCVNGGGQMAEWNDHIGVVALLVPPNVNLINTTVIGAEDFDHPVTPADAKRGTDPTSVGFTFTLSEDESVTKYDICMGSSVDNDDIFPCTWVSINISGTVVIKNGSLYMNQYELYKLSELRRDQVNITTNAFHMEPGRTLFVTLRACNDAFLCNNKSLGSVTMMDDKAVLKTSVSGEPIEMEHDIKSKRKKRNVNVADSLFITSPDGLEAGQSIVLQPLDGTDLTTSYASDSSPQFRSYIVNPDDTSDMVDRILYKRLHESQFSFAVIPVGHLSMPGPLQITYQDTVTDRDKTLVLTHWNPELQQWELSGKTCGDQDGTEVTNANGTVTVMVCSTSSSNRNQNDDRRRKRSTADPNYLSSESQFSLSAVTTAVYNTPPRLVSPNTVTMVEDEGTLQYLLEAVDDEGDSIVFYLDNTTYIIGEPILHTNGLLLYTPCVDCSGTETIRIILSENQTDPDIPVASLPVTLTVTITSQNDHPEIFITQYGQSMLHQDPSEPVIVYLEQMQDYNENIWSEQFTAVIGGYDVEKEDNLSMVISYPNHGNLTVSSEETILLRIDTCKDQLMMDTIPCGNFSQLLPYNETKMSWIYVTVTYIQPVGYFGYDRLKMYVMDNNNSSSEILTVEFAIMESPCQNNGQCQAKNTSNYPCEDTHRAESFDQYYDCVCSSGYTGQHCEEDVNECLQTPSPCPESYTCINTIGSYICTCPDCGIQPWMIAVIVICIIVILISAAIAVFCLRKKLRHNRWVYPSHGGNSGKSLFDDDIDEEELSSESENEEPVIPEVPRYQRQTVSFQMKTKNKFQFENHVPPPRQLNKCPGKLTSQPSHVTPWKPLPHVKEMPVTSTLGQKKPVFNLELMNDPDVSRTVSSVGDKVELPIVDEGGCFRESSLLSIESNMFPSDVCKQAAPAVTQTTSLDENLISFVVDSLNEETSA